MVPLGRQAGPIVLASALLMGTSVGAQAVNVPRSQFFDDKVAGQFQFLDKVMVSGGWCAATLSRWCRLWVRRSVSLRQLLEEFLLLRRFARTVRT